MSVAHALWLVNLILLFFTLFMARDVFSVRGRRAREGRRRFLMEMVARLEQLPEPDDMKDAWRTILSKSSVKAAVDDLLVSAICALENASDADVDALRRVIVPRVNLINQVAEFVDQGLVRPRDITRMHPRIHADLLDQLPLMTPFIWYESILQGRGRWGYRVLRLRTIFEKLRPISSRVAIKGPIVLEVEDWFFLALPSVTLIGQAWSICRLSIRSPTINVRSKVAQTRQRSRLESKLQEAGLNVRRATDPGTAVDW